jgi:phosphonate transport system ATP-binding protein
VQVAEHGDAVALVGVGERVHHQAGVESFDMGAFAANRADQLSGGQQQRVAIARALVQEARARSRECRLQSTVMP